MLIPQERESAERLAWAMALVYTQMQQHHQKALSFGEGGSERSELTGEVTKAARVTKT